MNENYYVIVFLSYAIVIGIACADCGYFLFIKLDKCCTLQTILKKACKAPNEETRSSC